MRFFRLAATTLAVSIALISSNHAQTSPSGTPSGSGEKVALILSWRESNQPFEIDSTILSSGADQAKSFYERMGFRVVEIRSDSPAGLNRNSVISTFESLRNVSKLNVEIFDHGVITNDLQAPGGFILPSLQPLDFTRLLTPGALHSDAIRSERTIFHLSSMPDTPLDWIGVDDLQEGIDTFQSHNPNAQTTLLAETCFSGFLGRLAHNENLQIFTSSNSNAETTALGTLSISHGLTGASYLDFFHAGLERGMSYQSAHEHAHHDVNELRMRHRDPAVRSPTNLLTTTPRSATQNWLLSWCDLYQNTHRSSDTPTAQTRDALERNIQHPSILAGSVRDYVRTQGCESSAYQAARQEMVRESEHFRTLALQTFIVQMRTWLSTVTESEYQNAARREVLRNAELAGREVRRTQNIPWSAQDANDLISMRESIVFQQHTVPFASLKAGILSRLSNLERRCLNAPQGPTRLDVMRNCRRAIIFFVNMEGVVASGPWTQNRISPFTIGAACREDAQLGALPQTVAQVRQAFRDRQSCLDSYFLRDAAATALAAWTFFDEVPHSHCDIMASIYDVLQYDTNCANRFYNDADWIDRELFLNVHAMSQATIR